MRRRGSGDPRAGLPESSPAESSALGRCAWNPHGFIPCGRSNGCAQRLNVTDMRSIPVLKAGSWDHDQADSRRGIASSSVWRLPALLACGLITSLRLCPRSHCALVFGLCHTSLCLFPIKAAFVTCSHHPRYSPRLKILNRITSADSFPTSGDTDRFRV